jgi:hypothetical protein
MQTEASLQEAQRRVAELQVQVVDAEDEVAKVCRAPFFVAAVRAHGQRARRPPPQHSHPPPQSRRPRPHLRKRAVSQSESRRCGGPVRVECWRVVSLPGRPRVREQGEGARLRRADVGAARGCRRDAAAHGGGAQGRRPGGLGNSARVARAGCAVCSQGSRAHRRWRLRTARWRRLRSASPARCVSECAREDAARSADTRVHAAREHALAAGLCARTRCCSFARL